MELETLQAAQAMFAVGSRLIFDEPADDNIIAMAQQDLFAGAPFGENNADVVEGFGLIRSWLATNVATPEGLVGTDEERTEALNSLRRDWLQLIAGVGEPKAAAWAGYYLSESGGYLSEDTLFVRRLYKRYGLELLNKTAEPDDNLGIMMSFLGHLISLEMDGTDTIADQQWLLEDRILPWINTWNYNMGKYARTDYFRGVAKMIFGLFCAYADRFGIRFDAEKKAFFK